MKHDHTVENITRKGLPVLVFFIVFVGWWISTSLFSVPKYLLPGPFELVSAVSRIANSFWYDLYVTTAEAVGGFLLGSAGGFFCAIIFSHFNIIETSLMPYVIAMKTIPIVAIAPLLVIWFGAGVLPKLILSALICFFPVLISTAKGMKEIDPDKVDLFRSFGASKWQIFVWLRLPSCLTYSFPALRVSVVFAVIGAIVAEFASANSGLGFKIMLASYHVDTAAMFLYIITTSAVSLVLYGGVVLAEYLLTPWSFSSRQSHLHGG